MGRNEKDAGFSLDDAVDKAEIDWDGQVFDKKFRNVKSIKKFVKALREMEGELNSMLFHAQRQENAALRESITWQKMYHLCREQMSRASQKMMELQIPEDHRKEILSLNDPELTVPPTGDTISA